MSQATRCDHGNVLCEKCVTVSDAAKRFSGNINGLITFSDPWEIRKSWIAVKLADGSYDGTIYDTRADAIRHQSDERLCCYFPIGNFMNGLSPVEAQLVLDIQRHAYDQGFRIQDEKTPDIFPTISDVDILKAWQRARSSHVN
jgi:hypothetical protein